MEPVMYAAECAACGALYHPSRAVCRECGGREFRQVPLEGAGTLLTYTRVYALPEGYMKPWLGFGIVQFPNGIRVAGQMATEELSTGMKVKAAVGLVKEGVGRDYYGFIFDKAE